MNRDMASLRALVCDDYSMVRETIRPLLLDAGFETVREATARPRASSRPVKTIAAPSAQSRSTIAVPIPEVPPVTRTDFPSNMRVFPYPENAENGLPCRAHAGLAIRCKGCLGKSPAC